MNPPRLAGLVALALAGSLSLAACGGDGDDEATDVETVFETVTPGADDTSTPSDPTTETTTPTEPTTESMTISPTGDVDEVELAEDIQSAQQIADGWWQQHWKDYFTGRYTAPNVFNGDGIYDGYDTENAPTCYGDMLPPGNAFYCPDGDYVAWDITLLELGYEIGDSWPYLIIAHEWGHAIQADLSMDLQSEQYELQADCLAGAVLYGSRDDGTLEFEPGDEKEIVDGLNFIADEVPWGMSGDHGDSFQRIEAFNLGRTAGVPGCLPDQVN